MLPPVSLVNVPPLPLTLSVSPSARLIVPALSSVAPLVSYWSGWLTLIVPPLLVTLPSNRRVPPLAGSLVMVPVLVSVPLEIVRFDVLPQPLLVSLIAPALLKLAPAAVVV